jgi:hypothetical protein
VSETPLPQQKLPLANSGTQSQHLKNTPQKKQKHIISFNLKKDESHSPPKEKVSPKKEAFASRDLFKKPEVVINQTLS